MAGSFAFDSSATVFLCLDSHMPDELDNSWIDYTALVTKIAASLLPIVGGPLGEVIAETIPRLRQDRIVEYLRQLNERVETLGKEHVELILADEERIDLVETGGYCAARSATPDRISKIAEIVFRGLCAEEVNIVRRKRLLALFGEVDDDEFLLLNAYGQSQGLGRNDAWGAIDRPAPAYLGYSREQIDETTLYELGQQNLLRLGLLERKYDHVKKDEYPQFDPKSGGFKSRIQISYLGRMLLREAGVDCHSRWH